MKFILSITLGTLFIFPALAQKLTIDKAIQVALENNYTVKIARNEEQITQNNFSLGNAGFYPELVADYDLDYGVQTFEQHSGSGEVRSKEGAESKRETYGATLSWTVFDGLRMFLSYDQLRALNYQSKELLQAEIELLVYNISSAFYSAALEKERLELFKSNVALSEERLQVARDRYELGKASKLEYLQAQVDLNADRSSEAKQMEVLAQTKYQLLRLMGKSEDSIDFVVEYELDNDHSLELSALLEQVESQNSHLLALKREQYIAQYHERILKGEQLPEVDLFAGYLHSNSENPAGFFIRGESDDISYGLSASWTLFNGFNLRRQIQNAKIQQQNARYQYEDQLLAYTTDIKTRYINYLNNLKLLKLEDENLSVARENNAIAQERYDIGLSNALELRESQINLINAELRRQDAAFAVKQAEVALKYLSGTLIMDNG